MSQAFYHTPPGDRREADPSAHGREDASTARDESPLRNNSLKFAALTPEERQYVLRSTEALHRIIETFCEALSQKVVTGIEQLAAQRTISTQDLVSCYVSTWPIYRKLVRQFEHDMSFYNREDPDRTGAYYRKVTTQVADLMQRLSNVVTIDNSKLWRTELQTISRNLRSCLSMDVDAISGSLKEDLAELRIRSAGNPEVP